MGWGAQKYTLSTKAAACDTNTFMSCAEIVLLLLLSSSPSLPLQQLTHTQLTCHKQRRQQPDSWDVTYTPPALLAVLWHHCFIVYPHINEGKLRKSTKTKEKCFRGRWATRPLFTWHCWSSAPLNCVYHKPLSLCFTCIITKNCVATATLETATQCSKCGRCLF